MFSSRKIYLRKNDLPKLFKFLSNSNGEARVIFTQKVGYSTNVFEQNLGKEQFDDYKRFISKRSSLREPAVTRQITALAYKVGKDFISLAEGMPNEKIFPFSRVAVQLKDGTDIVLEGNELGTALQYLPSQGLPALVAELKNFQKYLHSPPLWHSTDIIVTNGSQDGIYKSMEMLVEYGDPVLVPTPTYNGVDTILKPYRPEILGIPEDEEGIIPIELNRLLQERLESGRKMPKVMYLIPTGANPSGTVIPNERRKEIYEIACEYDFIILEDDPYQFMNYSEEFPQSFLSLDLEGRVLRFDSLSKVLSSGLRLGWVTGPKQLIEILELHMQASYLHSTTLTQVLVHKLFQKWGYKGFFDHFERVKQFYQARRDTLQELLERHLSGLAEWRVPQAGMFFWVKVKDVDDVYDMVVKRAFERGVMFIPGHAFMFDTKSNCPYIRLTFSKANAGDMEIAIRHLAELIKDEQRLYRARESVKA